jgi:hypothetical protein
MSNKSAIGKRNPLTDPQPNDVVQQRKGGLFLRVTRREGDRVWWEFKTPKGKCYQKENSWCVSAWADFVCDGATVVEVAE